MQGELPLLMKKGEAYGYCTGQNGVAEPVAVV